MMLNKIIIALLCTQVSLYSCSKQLLKQITKFHTTKKPIISTKKLSFVTKTLFSNEECKKEINLLKKLPGINTLINRLYLEKEPYLKGFIYELETAIKLNKEQKIVALSTKIPHPEEKIIREFDIITDIVCIECKNVYWPFFLDSENKNKIKKIKKQLLEQKKIAYSYDHEYCLYSKQPIPENLKSWLTDNNILFIES